MKKKVTVNDKMQKKYTYFLTEPIGKNFDKDFKPALSPKQMLALGVFGGVYMRDCTKEFPKEWFTKAKFAKDKRDAKNRENYYNKREEILKKKKEKYHASRINI